MTHSSTKFSFFRSGGFDQVQINSAEDLFSAVELDKKLWLALSCPVDTVEFDSLTLKYLDSDNDGFIRADELISAVKWTQSLIKSPSLLSNCNGSLPLSEINDSHEEGRQILISAKELLKSLNKLSSDTISLADTSDEKAIFANSAFNGDGVITELSTRDNELKAMIADIVQNYGYKIDKTELKGITVEIADRFFSDLQTYITWFNSYQPDLTIPKDKFVRAYESWWAVKHKIDDYFFRCKLCAYMPDILQITIPDADELKKLLNTEITALHKSIIEMPLSEFAKDKPLHLTQGINPAWTDAISLFRQNTLVNFDITSDILTESQWQEISKTFQPYHTWQQSKPNLEILKLDHDRIMQIYDKDYKKDFDALFTKEQALATTTAYYKTVDKLVRYCTYLLEFANNFIAFKHFYTKSGLSIFQAGTLYIDGRSCELCIQVNDIAKHAPIAILSKICLAYCECLRGHEKMTIAAAFTAGDSDFLMAGRNGVFYDRQGRDWQATIVRLIEHPISIQQAFWSPFKSISKLIGEQIQRLAAAKSKSVQEKAVTSAVQTTQTASPPQQTFDVAKFAGIFAAIGLAIGAIGTALASIFTGLLQLHWWQLPLVLAGIVLLISGPSMLIAWFKLSKRNLAPLLDANGWAINARAKINIPFGASLTKTAKLPDGTNRLLIDPFAKKQIPWRMYLGIAILSVIAVIAVFAVWYTFGATLIKYCLYLNNLT